MRERCPKRHVMLKVQVVLFLLLGGSWSEAAEAEEPPRSTVTTEAVERFQASIRARMAGSDALPDKAEDEWTSSDALRKDLRIHLAGFSENLTVLEVGSYFGYTTRILSQLFKRVIALDAVPELLQANRDYNSDRDNILYIRFHTTDHDWGIFSLNAIQVVFLDASHDFETVMHDIDNCLRIPTVGLIIFDDYGAEEGVRLAVQQFVLAGRLRPVALLGEGAEGPWRLRDGREVQDREAIACEVLRA
ncbi:tas [Symbiodinium natans]|uniref:Tas protein n=1 Tax=Symbiodinium natans TaxID=878477 RepID=A0A812TMH2_9DINO|nr:tas [Symbiodinium natans]